MLAGAFAHGQGQGQVAAPSPAAPEPAVEAPAPVPLPRASEPAGALVQPVVPASPVTPVMPGQGIAGTACPVCPPALPAADVQRLLDAATTLQTTAKEMKKDDSVFGNIFVNVLSNRIDSWLFGKGEQSRGAVALVAALCTLVVALIKLGLALRLPGTNSEPPSRGRRIAEVTLSVFLCVAAGLGVLAIYSARQAAAVTVEVSEPLTKELAACRAELQSAGSAGRAAPVQAGASLEEIRRVETACTANAKDVSTRLDGLRERVDEVYGARVGFFSKLFIFLGFVGVAVLLWRVLVDEP
ncbi:hypothetical protein C7T35_17840 [Variovorax sp. WS11]|nr:hypothetical protein C7T35_17840 [Variovorax sp. WS11]